MAQALKARRPFGLCHSGFECRSRNLELPDGPQGRNRQSGVLELVSSVKPGGGEIEQTGFVLIDKPAALLGGRPMLAGDL